MQMLISMKANIEDKGVKGDCTPLMEAANAGYVDIVQLLIANDADVNAKSTAGRTCIQILNILQFFFCVMQMVMNKKFVHLILLSHLFAVNFILLIVRNIKIMAI